MTRKTARTNCPPLSVLSSDSRHRAEVERTGNEPGIRAEGLVGGRIAPEPNAGRIVIDAEVPLVMLRRWKIDLGLLIQQPSLYCQLLPVALGPFGLTHVQ